jgi:hypothetical protein
MTGVRLMSPGTGHIAGRPMTVRRSGVAIRATQEMHRCDTYELTAH